MRVLVEDVVLRREPPEDRERARADRARVRERRGIAHLRPDVLRHDELLVQDGGDELRVDRLQLDDDRVAAGRPDGLDVRVGRCDPDQVHRLVLVAGGEAVDDVERGQRLAVRPRRVLDDVERQGLVPVAPLPGPREPRIRMAATGDARDDQRLVERAAHECSAGQARPGVGVEVLGEGRIAGAGHDEARVPRLGGAGGQRRRRSGRAGGQRRKKRCDPHGRGGCREPAGGANLTWHLQSFLLPGRTSRDRDDRKFPVTVTTFTPAESRVRYRFLFYVTFRNMLQCEP